MSDYPDHVKQASVDLLNRLLGNPETAAEAEDLISRVNPNADFPMKRAREAVIKPVMSELEKEREKIAALEAKLAAREKAEEEAAERARENSLLSRIDSVKGKYGFSDETLQRVMNRMREQNNPDVEAAAAWVAESIPKAAPQTGHDFLPTNVDPWGTTSGDEQWAGLHKDPDRWLTSELRSIARDPEFARLGNG